MKSTFVRVALVLFTAAFLSLAGPGCQTSKGFGQDVERLGERIQDKAD